MKIDYPLISVIVITYKRIELLKKTISSFLENTDYPNLELILCDDGSPKEIQAEMKKLPFDKFLFAKKNEGIGANTNKGIKNASGEFLLQLQDDWIVTGEKDYLRKGIEALSLKPDLGIVRFRVKDYEKFIISESLELNTNDRLLIIQEDESLQKEKSRIYSDTPHLKKKSIHDKIGFYKTNHNMEYTELDFCDRVSKQNSFQVGFLNNYKEIFIHIGELESFRTNTLRNKVLGKINRSKIGSVIYNTAKKYLKR